jgi:hypothetical protein
VNPGLFLAVFIRFRLLVEVLCADLAVLPLGHCVLGPLEKGKGSFARWIADLVFEELHPAEAVCKAVLALNFDDGTDAHLDGWEMATDEM